MTRGAPATARISALLALLVTGIFASPLAAQEIPFSDTAVEQAIERGKASLWSMYKPDRGHWEYEDAPRTSEDMNFGGTSALACYALLAADESYQSPRMKKALEWQAKLDNKGTYLLGIRCQIWAMIPRENQWARNLLKRDVDLLAHSVNRAETPLKMIGTDGMWAYTSAGKPQAYHGDHSNTQYGYLGLWAGVRSGREIEQVVWEQAIRHYLTAQNTDGGWSYAAPSDYAGSTSTGTMTTAGLASLFVAYDQVYNDQYTKVGQNTEIPAIKKGMDFLDANFANLDKTSLAWYHYYLYGVERVGLASGYKYFGKQDWYKISATKLINQQAKDGSFGNLINTSFSMLFLVRGRKPVLFNRLEYEGDWNNRPRAIANLCSWFSRTFEREVNWQIINTKTPVEEWHDAPILVLTGSRKPQFSPEELDKLRTYVQQGGMLLSMAEGGAEGAAFDRGMRQVYKQLFPDSQLKPLPNDHPIYGMHFKIPFKGTLLGLSNGARLLALHTAEDLPLYWQKNQTSTVSEAFQIATNLFFYATDKAMLLRARGTTLWPAAKDFEPAATVNVARLKYPGNWLPEPLALDRVALALGSGQRVKVSLADKSASELTQQDKLAVLSGTDQVSLGDTEQASLKAYVKSGGTLLVEATGGSEAFAQSAEKMLVDMFGQDSLAPLDAMDPIYGPGISSLAINSVKYRRLADLVGKSKKSPRLQGITQAGRTAVIFSREDLSVGLAASPCSCFGYDPNSSLALVRNIVLQAGGLLYPAETQTAPATSAPAP